MAVQTAPHAEAHFRVLLTADCVSTIPAHFRDMLGVYERQLVPGEGGGDVVRFVRRDPHHLNETYAMARCPSGGGWHVEHRREQLVKLETRGTELASAGVGTPDELARKDAGPGSRARGVAPCLVRVAPYEPSEATRLEQSCRLAHASPSSYPDAIVFTVDYVPDHGWHVPRSLGGIFEQKNRSRSTLGRLSSESPPTRLRRTTRTGF